MSGVFKARHLLGVSSESKQLSVTALRFSRTGRYVYSGDQAGQVTRWDVGASSISVWYSGTSSVSGLMAGPHEELVATFYGVPDDIHGRIVVIDEEGRGKDASVPALDFPVSAIAPADDPELCVVSGLRDCGAAVVHLRSGEILRALEGYKSTICAIAVRGRRAATAEATVARIWDLDTGRATAVCEGHRDLVTGVALDREGARAYTCSRDGDVRVWRTETGELLFRFKAHDAGVEAMALNKEGTLGITSGWDHAIRAWRMRDGLLLGQATTHKTATAVDLHGNHAAAGFFDSRIEIYDLELPESAD
jgi:WD40 repeat protein